MQISYQNAYDINLIHQKKNTLNEGKLYSNQVPCLCDIFVEAST